MLITTKKYQETAIENLVKSVSELLQSPAENKICVFQSPTGSGKTFMVARFIEDFITENLDHELCFLWVSIGKGELHKQSKRSLERYFADFPPVHLLEDEFFGSKPEIAQNEVVVVNWEKLYNKYSSGEQKGEWKNRLMRDGEFVNFRQVLENTKENRKIILIIDESHFAGDAARTNELREIINADVTLEMSATPRIIPSAFDVAENRARAVFVNSNEVIEEGMIKKELIINENLDDLASDENTSQEIIMKAAFEKRWALKQHFENEGVKINPLCLIQLPNADAGETKKEAVKDFLYQNNITEENGKLAIWLSEEKSDNLQEISNFDSTVEFLIFKQAIDTGWDCPRAHILVKLRDTQSIIFEIQTVGRILRMPEQKHYATGALNIGYIFTNIPSITVKKEEYNPNIIKRLRATRKEIYKELKLKSYYKNRVDFGTLTISFHEVLKDVFCEYFEIERNPTMINTLENNQKLKAKGLSVATENYEENILIDKEINSNLFDKLSGDLSRNTDKTISAKLSDGDLQDVFESVIKANLNGFAPKKSVERAKTSIYLWFKEYLGFDVWKGNDGAIKVQSLFLNVSNQEIFAMLLNKATGLYKPQQKAEVAAKIAETCEDWDIPKEESYNENTDEKTENQLCIYTPCYLNKTRSTPEKEFEKHLETKGNAIDWWYKNGEHKKTYFGIKYIEDDFPQTFYPDYIVQLNNGTLFIGDTKAGNTAKESKLKAEALQAYIAEQNANSKNLVGGIIIKANNQWRLNRQTTYQYDKNNLTGWVFLDDEIF